MESLDYCPVCLGAETMKTGKHPNNNKTALKRPYEHNHTKYKNSHERTAKHT